MTTREAAGAPWPGASGASLDDDDALQRIQRALGLLPRGGGLAPGRRIAIAVAVTWLPLVAWAIYRHSLLPGDGPDPLLRHFGIHARFLVALPLFLVGEATLAAALRRIAPLFVSSGLVDDTLRPRFVEVLRATERLRRSSVALVVLVALVALSVVLAWRGGERSHELVWAEAATGSAPALDLGGLWFAFVSRPIFTLLLLAWLWRIVVLVYGFVRVSALDLRLSPTHPDRAAGLGFLEMLPPALAPFFLGVSLVIAGRWGHDAYYHELDVRTLQAPALALIAVSVLLALAPLLAFSGRLRTLRRSSLARYGALLSEHGRLFERRWIRHQPVADPRLLEAPEIGPVADAVALYESVQRMRPAPIGRQAIVPIALAAALPFVPVFAIQMPLKEVILKLLGPLVGI